MLCSIFEYFHFYQFNPNFNGDYISIQEIHSNGKHKLVAYLSGPDAGPKTIDSTSNWDKKIISTSINKMNIEFRSDDVREKKGFSANIYFTRIPNRECESWLDMNKKTLKSPNYPQEYHNYEKCSWLITIDNDYHITLDVGEFYVRNQKTTNYDYFLKYV